MKIHAPNPNYTGADLYGTTTVLDFHDGVAEVDEDTLPAGVKSYLASAGYGLGRKVKLGNSLAVTEVPDPRDQTTEQVGSRLRDAAVNPQPERTRIDSEPVPDVVAELGARQLDAGEPKGGAKRDEWVDYARTQGAPETELGELGTEGALSRDDLRAKYGS